jgi:hypothetical protein
MPSRKKPAAALQYLDPSFFERSPKHRAGLEEARSVQEIGRALFDLRARAGLSLREVARAAGMTARCLERLENGETPRQSLARLRQVAAALGQRVELRIVSARGRAARRVA